MKKILFILLLFFAADITQAQVPDALKIRIAGKTKLTDIMREVDDFYKILQCQQVR